jgi:hypothetical protein
MCRREGLWLQYASAQALVDYYRCASGHVWYVRKDDAHAVQAFVTPDPVGRRQSA